jgi:hypothetical protein
VNTPLTSSQSYVGRLGTVCLGHNNLGINNAWQHYFSTEQTLLEGHFTPHSLCRNLTGTTTHLKVSKVSTTHRCEQSARTVHSGSSRASALSATLELLQFAGGAYPPRENWSLHPLRQRAQGGPYLWHAAVVMANE